MEKVPWRREPRDMCAYTLNLAAEKTGTRLREHCRALADVISSANVIFSSALLRAFNNGVWLGISRSEAGGG